VPVEQAWALVAYLESQGGTVDVSVADIQSAASAAPAAPAGFAGGSTDPNALIKEAGCRNCHMLDGEGGAVGPDLTHVGARRDAAGIHKKIVDPGSDVTKGFENMAGMMPKTFGTDMSPAQLDALVQFLEGHK
jgi:cytochrome c551/c552